MLAGAAGIVGIVGISPAQAASRVDGDHFARSGISIITQACTDQADTTVVRPKIIRTDPGRGDRSLRWTMPGPGDLAGPLAHVAAPDALEQVSTKLRWIAGGVTGGVVVHFHPAAGGVWKGYQELPQDTVWGWHTVTADLTSMTFVWRHFTDGVEDDSAPASTLRNLVNDRGGNADGAEVGFAFGCEGKDFVLDALKVTAPSGSDTYDYEGYASTAVLKAAGSRKVTVVAGGTVRLNAVLKRAVAGTPIRAKAQLQRKVRGKKWSTVQRLKLDAEGRASTSVVPLSASSYRIRYAGRGLVDGDVSPAVRVTVRANVRAHLARKVITSGQSLAVSGQFWPGRSAKLRLQRYSNYKWTTVKTLRSAKNGTFRVAVRSTRVGASYWRVVAPPGAGNQAGHSPAMKLTTKRRPGAGHSQPPTDPTPPPADNPQPPPPPTGPQ